MKGYLEYLNFAVNSIFASRVHAASHLHMILAQPNRISNSRSSGWFLVTIPASNKGSVVSKQQTAAVQWMGERNDTLKVKQIYSAPIARPLSIYGILDLGLQQSDELANVIQAFQVQYDLFNLKFAFFAQNAIS